MTRYYRVEIQAGSVGCPTCHAGQLWTIVYRRPGDPEDTEGPVAWENKDEAQEVCDDLNAAREEGICQVGAINQELLECVRAEHAAIDVLFARLIMLSTSDEPFFPSKSGLAWDACVRAAAIIKKYEGWVPPNA